MNNHGDYCAYYQAQSEGRGVGGVFKGVRSQRGEGLGSFLGGIFRRVMPYIKSGASAIGSELLNTGIGLLRDTLNGKDAKASVQERVTTAGTNLGTKASKNLASMFGMGYKRKARCKKGQSRTAKRQKRSRATSKKRIVRKRDIFGI